MSIQSSFTQPLSLVGILATQHPLVKKGVAVGETKKIINASQKTFDNMYYKSVVGASVDMTPSDLEKERELARVASKDLVEAKQKLAELQPTEKHKMEAITSAQIMGSEMSDIEDFIDAETVKAVVDFSESQECKSESVNLIGKMFGFSGDFAAMNETNQQKLLVSFKNNFRSQEGLIPSFINVMAYLKSNTIEELYSLYADCFLNPKPGCMSERIVRNCRGEAFISMGTK